MDWAEVDPNHDVDDDVEVDAATDRMLKRLRRLHLLVWASAPGVILENEFKELTAEFEKFVARGRTLQ